MPLTTDGGWYLRNGMLVLPASAFFLVALIIWILRSIDPSQEEKE
jgi:Na+-transporting NADH:ubiquinone oxidoreductase subunit D